MITPEEIQHCRSPSALRGFVDHVMVAVSNDIPEMKLGIQKRGWYKEFVDEIIPLSQFAAQMYPESYRIQPVLGNQSYDALVFDESGNAHPKVPESNSPLTTPYGSSIKELKGSGSQ